MFLPSGYKVKDPPVVKPQLNEAFEYLETIKSSPSLFLVLHPFCVRSFLTYSFSEFGADSDIYHDFLDMMKRFKAMSYLPHPPHPSFVSLTVVSVDLDHVISWVEEKFGDDKELIEGFQLFLQPSHRLQFVPKTNVANPEFVDARDFVKDVKVRSLTLLLLSGSHRRRVSQINQMCTRTF